VTPIARALAALFILLTGPAAAGDYRVGVNDTLGLRVQQWQPLEGLIVEWEGLRAEYLVGAAGTIAVPFIGAVEAAGRTRDEIGVEIAARLKERLALSSAPDATVEIVRYRPIYVTGLVSESGAFDYTPGLTVQQAVSLAGGLDDVLRSTSSAARMLIEAEGMLRIYEGQYLRLLVRKARLDAELAGRDAIEPPPGLADGARVAAIISDESLILTARQERVAREIEGYERQKELLAAEIDALEQKRSSTERQQQLGADSLESAADLAARGLAANVRVLDSERALAAIEAQLLDISTAILQARQGIVTADLEIDTVRDGYRADLAVNRQEVEAEIEALSHRIEMQRLLAADAVAESELAADDRRGLRPVPAFAIQRVEEGVPRRIEVDAGTEVLPGDVIEVTAAVAPTQ
jgi:polysaccharide biosynthesis/export protein ExoF